MHFGTTISYSCSQSLSYTERLLVGITSHAFARYASPNGCVIQSNHPSFILGHLSLYPKKIAEDLGQQLGSFAMKDDFAKVYSKDASCVDDPDGTIYPEMGRVVETYFEAYRAAISVLKQIDNSAFEQPNRNAAAINRFPTIGAMHAFYVSGHMMMHLGQLSAWRRAAGLPAA